MRYFGGKARVAKPLAAFLNNYLNDGQPFVDLFCGSCNVVSKIKGERLRVANDLHYELICMHKAVQDNTYKPERVTENEYKTIRDNKSNYEPWRVAFVGFGLSFSGKYFGGYARCKRGADYFANCVSSTLKKHLTMKDVVFSHGGYDDCFLPEEALIYCDIPYKGTVGYSTGAFSHENFYAWAFQKRGEGYSVLVSEYEHNVPDGWEVVWRHESKKGIRNKDGVQERTVEVLMRPLVYAR